MQAIKKSTDGQGARGSLYTESFISQFSGSGGGSLQKSMQEKMNGRRVQVNTVNRKDSECTSVAAGQGVGGSRPHGEASEAGRRKRLRPQGPGVTGGL